MIKKTITVFTFFTVLLLSAGCQEKSNPPAAPAAPEAPSAVLEADDNQEVKAARENGVLVLYFSNTGNTKRIAEFIADETGGDLYRIVPEVPYTSEDLNYGDSSTRATREQNDPSARPALSAPIVGLENYSTVFLGNPIWWGQAPKIMYTLVETHDFSGKTIIPFVTSGSSPIGSSATNLQSGTGAPGTWLAGRRFSGSTPKSEVAEWIASLDLQ